MHTADIIATYLFMDIQINSDKKQSYWHGNMFWIASTKSIVV